MACCSVSFAILKSTCIRSNVFYLLQKPNVSPSKSPVMHRDWIHPCIFQLEQWSRWLDVISSSERGDLKAFIVILFIKCFLEPSKKDPPSLSHPKHLVCDEIDECKEGFKYCRASSHFQCACHLLFMHHFKWKFLNIWCGMRPFTQHELSANGTGFHWKTACTKPWN